MKKEEEWEEEDKQENVKGQGEGRAAGKKNSKGKRTVMLLSSEWY